MAIDITPYIPTKEEVEESETLASVYARLRVISLDFFPEVKTTLNSVFGSTALNPLAHQIASYEIAMERIRSDMNLQNIANGTVYSCDFVEDFLANYGVSPESAVPVIGVVRLTFQLDKEYEIDRGAQILFGDTGIFHFLSPELGDIKIIPSFGAIEDGNVYRLVKVADNEYAVNITVIGSPGNVIVTDDVAATDIVIPELVSITAVNDFDTGRFPDNLPELAKLAQDIFFASNFADRGGAVSFIKRKLPNAVGVSAILSGDDEMQRDKNSILGVSTGKMDACVKGSASLVSDTALVNVLLSSETDTYVGKIVLPGGVPLYIDNITREDDQAVDTWEIVGTSGDPDKAGQASGSFSYKETLGVKLSTPNLQTSSSYFEVVKNAEPGFYPALDGASSGGIYTGSVFSDRTQRNLIFKPNGVISHEGELKGVMSIEDILSGDCFEGVLVKKDGKRGVIDFDSGPVELKRLLNDINLFFTTEADDFILTSPDSFSNQTFQTAFGGKATRVKVTYRYDPSMQIVKDFVRSTEVQPVNDVLVKGFNTVYIDNFTLSYRRTQGTTVNKEQILDELVEYMNSLTYPNKYEEAVVSDIILFGGAAGVTGISFSGKVYHTLAEKWSPDGSEVSSNYIQTAPDELLKFNDKYERPDICNIIGLRNVHYILDRENIVLSEVAQGDC
jgi:hypothetical protein